MVRKAIIVLQILLITTYLHTADPEKGKHLISRPATILHTDISTSSITSFAEESFESIHAGNILECTPKEQLPSLLATFRHIMRSDGTLHLTLSKDRDGKKSYSEGDIKKALTDAGFDLPEVTDCSEEVITVLGRKK